MKLADRLVLRGMARDLRRRRLVMLCEQFEKMQNNPDATEMELQRLERDIKSELSRDAAWWPALIIPGMALSLILEVACLHWLSK